MNPIIYRSTDTSAPVINNSNGSLVTLLDAILVNGYGAKSPLGWTIEYTATNERSYRPPAGTRMYLAVTDDNGANAKVRGFETMTAAGVAVANGTGPFPTAAQLTNGCFAQKSSATAGDREWFAIGDDKGFILGAVIVTASSRWNYWTFGDIGSAKAGDAYNCILIGKASSVTTEDGEFLGQYAANAYTATIGHYMPRSHTQIGSAVQVGKFADQARHASPQSGRGTVGSSTMAYPDPVSGNLQLCRFFISESGIGPRGYLRGAWCVCHNLASMSGVANGDAFTGSDALNAMTFELRADYADGVGAIAVETTAAAWT